MIGVQIPNPCHENWNNMLPADKGRNCLACAKTVVDFTNMSDHEVQHYLLHNGVGNTCGRFKKTQLTAVVLDIPMSIINEPMALWKKFLAAVLIVFGSFLTSCNEVTEKTKGMIIVEPTIKNNLTTDSITKKDTLIPTPKLAAPIEIEETKNYNYTLPNNDDFIVGEVAAPFQIPAPEDLIGKIVIDSTKLPIKKDSATCAIQNYQ